MNAEHVKKCPHGLEVHYGCDGFVKDKKCMPLSSICPLPPQEPIMDNSAEHVKLVEQINLILRKNADVHWCNPNAQDEIATFIIADRKRIVAPLVKVTQLPKDLNMMKLMRYIQDAIQEALRLAGEI